jgi:outer membrane protein TolC
LLAPGGEELPADSLADFYGALSPAAVERWLLRRSPDAAAARAALRASRARTKSEGALADPEVDLAIGPSAIDDPQFGTAYRVAVMQPLGLTTRGGRAALARSDADAESARVATAESDLLLAGRRAVIEYQRAEAALRALVELRPVLDGVRRAALARYAAGVAGEADPLMAEMDQVKLEHEEVLVERDRELARVELNTLLHRRWDAPLPPSSPTLTVPWPPEPLDSLIARAWRQRPEITEREAAVRAAEARHGLARAAGWPDLSLMAAYDRFWVEEPLRPMVGVRLNLPLWRGRLGAERAAARAGIDEASARAAAERARIAHEVHRSWLYAVETAHEAELIEKSELPVTRRASVAARAAYESGSGDIRWVLEAERAQVRVRLDQVRVYAEHLQARVELARAVGDAAGAPTLPAREWEGIR